MVIIQVHFSMGPSDSDNLMGEGLGRLTLRFGATRTNRPERVFFPCSASSRDQVLKEKTTNILIRRGHEQ